MNRNIVVIGAGIVGVSSALALLRDGHRVTILDPAEPGGRQAASYGNGAWISPASVVPMSMPGLWRKVPVYLLDRAGPFTIRPMALPALLPWLVRFLLAGASESRVDRTSRLLRTLLEDGPDRHVAMADATGVSDLIRRNGLLYAYPDRATFEAEALAWDLRRRNGVGWTELDEAALRAREPDLSPRYRFGALVEAGAHCRDTGAYVAALAAHARSLGARLVSQSAKGFRIEAGRLRAVTTSAGEIACDGAVISAGIASKALAREAGDGVSLISERGYHVVVPGSSAGPRLPVMPSDGKMANTPTAAGLRAAGQVELAAGAAEPDWRRADILLAHLARTYPDLDLPVSSDGLDRWMGHRPSTPDGLPVVGPASASPDIVHAFGHGHVGFAAAPITGAVVADFVAGRRPALPIEAFAATRFRWGRLGST